MTSKEALEQLRLKFIEHNNEFDYSIQEFNDDIDRFSILEQDLYRLEKLEKVIEILKEEPYIKYWIKEFYLADKDSMEYKDFKKLFEVE